MIQLTRRWKLAEATVENIGSWFRTLNMLPPGSHRLQGRRARERNEDRKGELLAIFDADFVPILIVCAKLVNYFTDPMVAARKCAGHTST